jgi:plasmid stabilization system protein ParE
MKCEEFEAAGFGLTREGATVNGIDAVERALAIEHANSCPRCAALQESWREAQAELQALRTATKNVSAPPRVEMRLRQEFRTKHRTVKARRAAVVAAWTLAAAAVIVGAVSLRNWQESRISKGGSPAKPGIGASAKKGQTSALVTSVDTPNENTLVADNHADGFTLLPGSFSQETGDAAIVRVRLQRGALGVLGLPVNEERAGEWIQVDLLVGEDGQPQAVRLGQ